MGEEEETAPDADVGGLTLQLGANDGNALTCKSSDVAHGVTNYAEADTFFQLRKLTYFGLEDTFDSVVTSEEVGQDKSDERNFILALKKLYTTPKVKFSFKDISLASLSERPTELISGCVNVAAGILL